MDTLLGYISLSDDSNALGFLIVVKCLLFFAIQGRKIVIVVGDGLNSGHEVCLWYKSHDKPH